MAVFTRKKGRPTRVHVRMTKLSRGRRGSFRAACPALCLFLFVCFCATLLTTPVSARLIFDPTDPAFGNALLVPFAPGDAASGARSFTITRNGVRFSFSTASADGIFFCDSAGNCDLRTPFPEGIELGISPPVPAIGFAHRWLECPGQATFTGSLATETFTFPFSQREVFIGASDIGDISHVRLEGTCPVPESWDDMRFVPPASTPPTPTPTPNRADLSINKTGPARAL